MAVAKRQGREKPAKIEQRKVRGPEWGTQVEQTAFLASPIYIGQARGEEKTYKKRSQRAGGLSVSRTGLFSLFLLFASFGSACPHASSEDVFSFYFLNKTDLSKNYTHGLSESCNALRALTSIASNLGCDETEPRRLHSPDRWMVTSVQGRDAGVQHPTLTDPLGESWLCNTVPSSCFQGWFLSFPEVLWGIGYLSGKFLFCIN